MQYTEPYPLKTFLVKGFTLMSFASLMSLFVVYKGGYFDDVLLSGQAGCFASHNGGNVPSNTDTTQQLKNPFGTTFPSSKSGIIFKGSTPPDTSQTNNTPPSTEDDLYWGGSKSGILIENPILPIDEQSHKEKSKNKTKKKKKKKGEE